MTPANTALSSLLDSFRHEAKSLREQGRYFEDLGRVFFRQDAKQQNCYEQIWTYEDWAKQHGEEYRADCGIDLVARLRGDQGLCAIQAKFYEPGKTIQRGDVNSFFAESEREVFTHRAIIDTSGKDYGKPLQRLIDNSLKPFSRIRLADLERSNIDWSSIPTAGAVREEDAKRRKAKTPFPHQRDAVEKVRAGLASADRGQIVMACGTGKTYTAQLIAEDRQCRRALVLVPSLALVSQTIAEWCQDARLPMRAVAVCSDTQVGRRRTSSDDSIQYDIHDLAFPATTDAEKLADRLVEDDGFAMTVVFATYQSLDVISRAQHEHGLQKFDLVVCDEAHRTTGQIDTGREASNFVRVHEADFLHAEKRLYMTATPRIYTDSARSKAAKRSTFLCTMDDESLFGDVLVYNGFGWAVRNGLLSDYQVVVLALDEEQVSRSVQHALSADNELRLDDAVKILGSYKALLKQSIDPEDFADDDQPARRAMAFSNTIAQSQFVRNWFDTVVGEYRDHHPELQGESAFACEVRHVDGTTRSSEREEHLRWLGQQDAEDRCHILSNVRCLGEGVDVPALDAVLFLHPRKSQIDVVQAVGRVMRKAKDKKRGYVILPVGVPAGVPPEQALSNNERYRIIWQILNALKSHDERLEAQINAASFGEGLPADRIRITVCDLTEVAPAELGYRSSSPGGSGAAVRETEELPAPTQGLLALQGEIAEAIKARIVQRCGARDYWEDWAGDVQEIARSHVARIHTIVSDPEHPERAERFRTFLAELRDDLNPSISKDEAIEMLAQHLITRPVFDAVFSGNEFTEQNSVSQTMQRVVEMLDAQHIGKESASLKAFYASVRHRAGEVKSAEGKQNLIRRLYESFFRKSFRALADKLGIVYTPIEAVDYILHATDAVMREGFGFGLGERGVSILDPFTGTGTFLVRAITSDLIAQEDLPYKYCNDLYASEIVPLAYYIAGINIENAYHERRGLQRGDGPYEGFDNLSLTDTFQLSEHKGALSELFVHNQKRIDRQAELDFLAIIGNPPYSAGQRSANENAPNVAYPHLDQRIAGTYAQGVASQNRNALYDSYIRAIRWASDRIGDRGVIGFITNGGWLDGASTAGLRRCLCEEYTSMYVLNMRGDARTSGELRRKEKDSIFGQGTRTPVAILVFVKDPTKAKRGEIHYHDIGDYLTREEKLAQLVNFAEGHHAIPWQKITPDPYGDWINQRDPHFEHYILLGDKKNQTVKKVFALFSNGLYTKRDAWCYNASRTVLEGNIRRSVNFYNAEVERYAQSDRSILGHEFVNNDPASFSWDDVSRRHFSAGKRKEFHPDAIRQALYRPFSPRWVYYHPSLNARRSQLPHIFPTPDSENRVICVSGIGDKEFSALMVSVLPDLHVIGTVQCFPQYTYAKLPSGDYERLPNITESALSMFHDAYPNLNVDRDLLFDYIYGLLHSPDYRERFGKNLLKQLPRIPAVASADDFIAFAQAGRVMGDLHVNYEQAPLPDGVLVNGKPFGANGLADKDYRVTKMRFAGRRGKDLDRSTVIYNHQITVSAITEEAYSYSVHGKSPVEWVMDRQRVTTHKVSQIENDPNRYALETVEDAAYPLKLLLRAITVGIETARIVSGLPSMKLDG